MKLKPKQIEKLHAKLLIQPKTKSNLELMHAIMHTAKKTNDKFFAMDLHNWITDLALNGIQEQQAYRLLFQDIMDNQERLAI